MAERYEKLYALPGGLFLDGAPVMICAGALLRDTTSGNLIAQLKYYNLGERTIAGLTVALCLLDGAGRRVGTDPVHRLDFNAEPDTEFGQKKAMLVPYRNVRSFSAVVTEVRFADGTVWTPDDDAAEWVQVPARQTLEQFYGDEELASQFRIHYSGDWQYAPVRADGIWYCTCGAVNRSDATNCRRCRRPLQSLLEVNVNAVKREASKRVQEEAFQDNLDSSSSRSSGTAWKVLGVVAALLLALAVVIYFVPKALNVVVPLPSFEPSTPTPEPTPTATPRPTPSPTPTPIPTPSPEELMQMDYDAALALLEAGSYSAARDAFLELGDFSDSADMAREAFYRKAVSLYEFIEQYDEEGLFALLSTDSNGTTRFSLSPRKALSLGSPAIAALRQACGKDKVDIQMTENTPDGLRPIGDCVKDLFAYLGDYRDSAERLENLDVLTDYTRDFYMFCEAGDIYSAYDWLYAYNGEFPHKDNWLQLLDMYKPFCSDWELFLGDPTLLPMTLDGLSAPCYSFNSRVLIKDGVATLRFLFREGEADYTVDIPAEAGTTNFMLAKDVLFYIVQINQVDHLAYMKYYEGSQLGSCEYERVKE